MKVFKVTLKHDNGKTVLKVPARNKQVASEIVCKAEGCPPCAILSIK